ncbi:hypothetical protein ABZ484_31720 [Streptomyces sp. NPDC006393]|uniref:hypothetical protein n=1 Tax=Streptomyces sp. NPDC006393 TaxID=3156763 RepID=UPI0033D8E2C0
MLCGRVLPALLVHDGSRVWLVYLVLFGVGLGVGTHNAAGSALLTRLVHPDALLSSQRAAAHHAGRGMLVAPAAGSFLYLTLGARAVAVPESATFLVCALCVPTVRVDEPAPEPPAGRRTEPLVAGIRRLAVAPRLRAVCGTVAGGARRGCSAEATA